MKNRYIALLLFVVIFSIKIPQYFEYQKYDYKNNSLFSAFDSYRFVRFAKDMGKGKYIWGKTDSLVRYPIYKRKYAFYPLPSVLLVILHKISGLSYSFWATILPPIFSSFIGVSLFYFLLLIGINRFISFIVSFLYSFQISFYLRTLVGRYDTDMLIIPFFIVFIILLIRLIRNYNVKNNVILMIFIYFFMWWYYKPDLVVMFFCSYMLSVMYIYLFINRNNKELINKIIISIIIFSPYFLYKGIISILSHFSFYSKGSQYLFNGGFTTEMTRPSVHMIIEYASTRFFVGILSLIGFILYMIKEKRKEELFIYLPAISFYIFSYKIGARFLIYAIPFLSVGLSFFFMLFGNYLNKKAFSQKFIYTIFVLLVFVFIPYENIFSSYKYTEPVIDENAYKILYETGEEIKKEAIDIFVWSWWDMGHIIQEATDLPVLADNEGVTYQDNAMVSMSLITDSDSISSAVIHFWGLEEDTLIRKNLFKNKIRDIYREFKNATIPIKYDKNKEFYIAISKKMLLSSDDVFNYGMNIFIDKKEKQKGRWGISVVIPDSIDNHLIYSNNGLIDIDRKEWIIEGKRVPIKKMVYIRNGCKDEEYNYRDNGIIAEIIMQNGVILSFIMMNDIVYKSVFNKLVFTKDYDKNIFEPVLYSPPYWVIYKVKPIKQELR